MGRACFLLFPAAVKEEELERGEGQGQFVVFKMCEVSTGVHTQANRGEPGEGGAADTAWGRLMVKDPPELDQGRRESPA